MLKFIGWLVSGTFYPNSPASRFRIDMIKIHRPETEVIVIYAEKEPCGDY